MNASNPLTQNDTALDQTFATAGIFRLDTSIGRETLLHGIKAQYSPATERIYFTGQAGSSVNSSQYVLGCLRPDGTLDDDFATEGVILGNFIARTQSVGISITLLPDGKILLIGRVNSGKWLPGLARFSAEGVLDTTFGTATDNHHVILRMPGSTKDPAQSAATNDSDGQEFSTSVVPLADGKILVIHTYVVTHQADTRAYIFLLNSNGSYETSFNGTGYKQVIYPGANQIQVKLRGGLIDQDGTIVVCGGLEKTSRSSAPLMARYTLKGELVPGFGTGGFFTTSLPSDKSAEFETVIVQPNKRLLGIGTTSDGHGLLISLESNATFNIQFNKATPLLTRLAGHITSWKAGAMQLDGQIVVCGSIKPTDEPSKGVVARFNDNGTPDETFFGGWAGTPVDGITIFKALTLQDDGKILTAGYRNGDSSFQGLVLRYHANGAPVQPTVSNNHEHLDPTFGTGGIVQIGDINNPSGKTIEPLFVGTDSAGRVLVGGSIRVTFEHTFYCCLRMTSTGVIDTSFADKGFFIGDFLVSNKEFHLSRIEHVVELSDGKLLLIGDYFGTLGTWKGVIRLHADGRLDTSFGDQGMTLITMKILDTDSVTRSARPDAASTPGSLNSIPVLPDGKLLLYCPVFERAIETASKIIRLTPEGAMDTSFNKTGELLFAHPSYDYTVVTDILLDGDKYVLTGHCTTQGHRRTVGMFARLLSTGEIDISFNKTGYLFIDSTVDPWRIFIHRIVLQTNRRLLGIGEQRELSAELEQGLLTSRELDGSPNIQFNGGKPLLTRLGDESTRWYNARIQADGSILVYGSDRTGCVVAKFSDAGVLDSTYGNGGWRTFPGQPTIIASSLLTDETVLYSATMYINDRSVACVVRGLLQ